MKQSRSDPYFQNYGVWEEDLAIQLLWAVEKQSEGVQHPRRRLVHIPTWSWATTTGSKLWIKNTFHCDPYQGLDGASAHLTIDAANGGIISSGHLTRHPLKLFATPEDYSDAWDPLDYFSSEATAWRDLDNLRIVTAGYDETLVLGLAGCDDQPFAQAKCFVLGAETRETHRVNHDGDLHSTVARPGSTPEGDVEQTLSLVRFVVGSPPRRHG